MRSFADPSTEFEMLISGEGDHDGHQPGEPTGEVRCVECGQVAMDVDLIDHECGCPQADVHSRARCDQH